MRVAKRLGEQTAWPDVPLLVHGTGSQTSRGKAMPGRTQGYFIMRNGRPWTREGAGGKDRAKLKHGLPNSEVSGKI